MKNKIKEILIKVLSVHFYVPLDKLWHFVAGWTISTGMSVLVEAEDLSIWLVLVVTSVIAILKELGDKYIKKTEFDINDALFTIAPAVAQTIILLIK